MKQKLFFISLLLFFSAGIILSQNSVETLRSQAVTLMNSGRYGEAIDLLNKYVAAKPHVAEGLNLRGLCYEKRGQYDMAVYDLRIAAKIEPSNREIQKNLTRMESNWHKIIYKKIEGHKRQLAVNPNSAVDYLEIGKCNKNLGKWNDAEYWYDEFLKRADASPDEVIRYSEILAMNKHLVKGEKILKTYTDRFPKDQRLWSRYGYFLLWLGKYKPAIKAFEAALAIKPFWREAQDGLDQAKGKAYIYTYTDTTYRHKKGKAVPEYPIDKLYRIAKKNPDDVESRFSLVDELVKAERIEEAYQQLQLLSANNSEDPRFQPMWDKVTEYRTTVYNQKITDYSARLQKDSSDRTAARELAKFYSYIGDFDSALLAIEAFLNANPGQNDAEMKFLLAKYSSWNRQFDRANELLDILLGSDPNNIDYQLLKGQIGVWTDQDLDKSKEYLENVLKNEPENIHAVIALASLAIKENEFEPALSYIAKAKQLDPSSKEVENVQNYYELRLLAVEEEKIYEILTEGRNLAMAQQCEEALVKYDEYFSKIQAPTNLVLMEYAEVNMCTKNFSKAIEVYDKILTQGEDQEVLLLRAKAYLWSGDSLNALNEFQKLVELDSSGFEQRLYMGDALERLHRYDEARDVYDNLLLTNLDSTQRNLVTLRLGWLPVSGIYGFLSTFPSQIGVAPYYAYYSDNFDFQIRNAGARMELGINSFLTAGFSFNRGNLSSNILTKNYSTFKGHLFLRISKRLSLSGGMGSLTYQGNNNRKVSDVQLKYEKDSTIAITGYFESTDAGLLMYSAKLINDRITAEYYRLSGSYNHKDITRLSAYYSFISLSDGNLGNDLQLRIQKKFEKDLWAGYEYFYSNYKFQKKEPNGFTYIYYSPQDFESHSLFGEWDLEKNSEYTITLGGKIGYVPSSDFMIREGSLGALYKPLKGLTISGKVTFGGTYRYDSNYRYLGGNVSAYWSF